MVFSPISLTKKSTGLLAAISVALLSGCGAEAPPPYDVLPLRDALQAAPDVMATLSQDSRRELAERFAEAEHADESLTFTPPEVPTLDNLVSAADTLREEAGKDALILGELSLDGRNAVLETHAPLDADAVDAGPLDVHGKADAIAAPFEEAALRGRAGKTLRGLVSRTHAKSIVRMTGLPVGAVALDDKVYVNESWLVALSALEDDIVVAPLPEMPGDSVATPQPKPLSVDFSPYDLPGSLSRCAAQVKTKCQCGVTMSCSHVPTDSTFADANAECAWVNQAQDHASAICILALLSMDPVKECVDSAWPACAAMPVRTRDDAVNFATNAECVSILDTCLDKGEPATATGSSTNCDDACNDCKYCDNKGNDCQECADDCQTTADACEACAEICAICAENAERTSENGTVLPTNHAALRASQCSTRPRPGRSPLPAPMGTVLWLFAPVAYLFRRSRRRP